MASIAQAMREDDSRRVSLLSRYNESLESHSLQDRMRNCGTTGAESQDDDVGCHERVEEQKGRP